MTQSLMYFQSSLLGSLTGDCCGAPYEGQDPCTGGERLILKKYFDKLKCPYFTAPRKSYTDDTAMTVSVANVLIENGKELAVNFVKEYYKDSRRGNGGAVVQVFEKLRKRKFSDPLQPAREQFSAKQSALVTHSHKQGIDGTVSQALSVHAALLMDPEHPLNTQYFVSHLISKMKAIEIDEEGLGLEEPKPFTKQLESISRFLAMSNEPSDSEVLNVFGNDVSALYSVPTSIYCFLKSQKAIKGIDSENPFRRALEYAISLGGDTDTIASMAGAISGAYYGESIISPNLVKHLEIHEEVTALADKLYEASLKT